MSRPPRPTPLHPAVRIALDGGPMPKQSIEKEFTETDRDLLRIMRRLRSPYRGPLHRRIVIRRIQA